MIKLLTISDKENKEKLFSLEEWDSFDFAKYAKENSKSGLQFFLVNHPACWINYGQGFTGPKILIEKFNHLPIFITDGI